MKLYKQVCKLSNITRFTALKLDRPYNVAEHSYRVAMLTMVIVDEFNANPFNTVKLDKAEALSKALIHDLEESVIGDIATPVKTYPGFRDLLRKASEQIMETQVLDEDLVNRNEYLKHWVEDKDGATGEVITIADKMEALMAAAYELKRGNKDLQKAFNNIRGWFDTAEAQTLMDKFPVMRQMLETADEVPQVIESCKMVG